MKLAIPYSFGFRYEHHDTTTVTRVDTWVSHGSHEGLAVIPRRKLASWLRRTVPDSDCQPCARARGARFLELAT